MLYKEDSRFNLTNLLKNEWWGFLGIFNTISTRSGKTFKNLQNLNLTIHVEIIIINNLVTTFKICKFKNLQIC